MGEFLFQGFLGLVEMGFYFIGDRLGLSASSGPIWKRVTAIILAMILGLILAALVALVIAVVIVVLIGLVTGIVRAFS